MLIGVVENLTGITKKNIRFYEKVGLLNPNRNDDNKYRDYSDEDVKALKKIKLLRKLGISIDDISLIQKEALSLNDCMNKYVTDMRIKVKEMEEAIEICEEIKVKEKCLNKLNADDYLLKLNNLEEKGVKFMNIANDFLTKVKEYIPKKPVMWFEPNKPIITKREFTDEIFKYSDREKIDITILKEGMKPIIEIDGVKYVCMLQQPTMVSFPLSILFVSNTYGFRFVYIYKYD